MQARLHDFMKRWWFSLFIVVILVAIVFFVTPIGTVLSRYYTYLPTTLR